MSTILKLRRGTSAQTASFTGAAGEVTIDTTKNTVVVHDGAQAGGFPLAKESAIISAIASLGFTPYNATNPSGFITGINSGNVTTALGFTPYNATNPSGFITSAGTVATANALNAANGYTVAGLTVNGAITATGNITAYSDERLKTNWRVLPADFIAQLAAVKHGTYDRTDNCAAKTQDGVSAQSLQSLLPNSVTTDTEGMLSVNYGGAALVSSVQLAIRVVEQDKRIAALEALLLKKE